MLVAEKPFSRKQFAAVTRISRRESELDLLGEDRSPNISSKPKLSAATDIYTQVSHSSLGEKRNILPSMLSTAQTMIRLINTQAELHRADMTYFNSLFSLEGKTALVTGGATGIGRMMAEAMVRAGAKVMIASRKGDACEAVANQLNALDASGSAVGFAGDLSTEEGLASLVEK